MFSTWYFFFKKGEGYSWPDTTVPCHLGLKRTSRIAIFQSLSRGCPLVYCEEGKSLEQHAQGSVSSYSMFPSAPASVYRSEETVH